MHQDKNFKGTHSSGPVLFFYSVHINWTRSQKVHEKTQNFIHNQYFKVIFFLISLVAQIHAAMVKKKSMVP